MQLSNIPGKLVLPWATSGNKNDIPVASQIGITAGAASLTDGFPPLTMTPVAAGGVPPSGLDMNGILYEMSTILRWANAGGGYAYDSTFANDSHVGGYPKGARIMRSDGMGYWFNTVDNNTTDPETAGAAAAGWVPDYQAGATSVAMSGSSVTLTPAQYGKPLIVITGALSANLNLIFPTLAQGWTIINNTTGGYSITAKTPSGSGVVLGTISQIVGDGANIYAANPDSVQIVTNVATLRNITPNLSRRIQTRGYYTDGDGGSGQYFAKVGAAPGTYVHDGGAVIVPNGGDGSSAWLLDIAGVVNYKQFGAKGDKISDDTASIHNAWTYAISHNMAAWGPSGVYRVTSGYNNSVYNGNLVLIGENPAYASSTGNEAGTCIILDSVDGSSYLYQQSNSNELIAQNMQFACVQNIVDRKYFVTSASSVKHTFENVTFIGVEQPFVYLAGTYFQMSSYRNIRFTSSGSFHSKTSTLVGTFMLIDNVDIEGAIPANSEKIICNLQGIRQIQGINFLIEPSTPSAGWIGLLLRDYYDADWTRFSTATFRGFWAEVAGSGLTYAVQQDRGRSLFVSPQFNNGASSPIRLNEGAAIEISDASFSGTIDPLQNYFSLSDQLSQVRLVSCNYRNAGTIINSVNITLDNCSNVPAGGPGYEPFRATNHNNAQSQLMYAFDGGYPEPGKVAVDMYTGTTYTPTVNAAFGRALRIMPNAGTINSNFQILTRGDFPIGAQFFLVLRATMPTLSSGTTAVNMIVNGSVIANPANYTSGQDIRLVYPICTASNNPANVGININTTTATGDLLIYQLEIWIGKSLPSVNLPSHPSIITTWGVAAPTAGQWNRGDRVFNNTPTVGQPKSWVCTVAGTPGTWVSEGNL